jgi:hypothetical protein
MKKHVAGVRLVDRDEATEAVELPEELRLSLGAIAGVAREGLLAMCTTVGLAVMGEMMTAEMTAKVGGPKHAKLAHRQGNWHGSAPGSVVLGGRRVPVERPPGPHRCRRRDRARRGAKALATAVRKVFGDTAFIQRCTLHKRRNVHYHLPKDQQAWVDRKLAAAFNHDDPAKGERACRDLTAPLEARLPDAAASLREGLEDMFTQMPTLVAALARHVEAVTPACDSARVA